MSSATVRMDDDLTAKARIRNAALELYARQGEDRTSMRAVAGEAGVTVGLVVHHYGSKNGLREAVELRIVDHFAGALDSIPDTVQPSDVARARNESVAAMLESHPEVVDYLRRVLLETPDRRGPILGRLTALTFERVEELRSAGIASLGRSAEEQTTDVLIEQLGQLFLQPLVDAIWEQLGAIRSAAPRNKPGLVVRISEAGSGRR